MREEGEVVEVLCRTLVPELYRRHIFCVAFEAGRRDVRELVVISVRRRRVVVDAAGKRAQERPARRVARRRGDRGRQKAGKD